MLLLVWGIIGVVFYVHYNHERSYRTKIMRDELSMIDQRIISNYEKGYDMVDFVRFLESYYERSVYDEMRISVYNADDSLIVSVGDPISPEVEKLEDLNPKDTAIKLVKYPTDSNTDLFYFSSCKSRDGKINVKTGMPYTFSISKALAATPHWWILLLIVSGAATIVVSLSTRMMTRNIAMLRQFARKAVSNEPVEGIGKFPNDELGEIASEIYEIYNQRMKAIERSEREHRISLHAIEEKALIKRQMTNNINHELKTPIGVIRGYLDTILDNPDMDEATRDHFMKRTRDNVERLCSLLNDVSTITRLDEGSENIPMTDVDMHDLLYGIENDFEGANIAPGMKFSYKLPLDCHVLGNQGLISGLILNLIRNAAMHSHGTEMMFRLVSESSKFYVFSFSDNGVGVGPEHIPHLFDRFYRVDSGRSRKAGGTGLGLPIVKSTVTSLGGSISVHNRSTGGLEFVFTLRKYTA